MMSQKNYRKSRKRVKRIKGFYQHFGTWVVFSVFFIMLNIFTSPYDFWAIFPILGWGTGVAIHGLSVLGLPGLGKDWEKRMIQREMDRLERVERNPELPEPGWNQRHIGSPPADEDELELKELRKDWHDSDLV